MLRRAALLQLAVAAALAFAAPASASLRDEVAAGGAIAVQLRAGTVSCTDLSDTDFEHLGEYAMSRMTGSPQLHAAMNERMRAHMGAANEARMHALIGRRYAGCAAAGNVGPMMRSGDWDWMRDGNWQHMTRADWRRVSERWMGPGMMGGTDSWTTTDTVLVGIAAVLAVAFLGALLARKSRGGLSRQSAP